MRKAIIVLILAVMFFGCKQMPTGEKELIFTADREIHENSLYCDMPYTVDNVDLKNVFPSVVLTNSWSESYCVFEFQDENGQYLTKFYLDDSSKQLIQLNTDKIEFGKIGIKITEN